MVSLMFETFQVKKLYLAPLANMSLYKTGRTTGLVCDVGDSGSYSIPIFDGLSNSNTIGKTEIGGRILTEWMQKLLTW